jgi:hypothetical protein
MAITTIEKNELKKLEASFIIGELTPRDKELLKRRANVERMILEAERHISREQYKIKKLRTTWKNINHELVSTRGPRQGE